MRCIVCGGSFTVDQKLLVIEQAEATEGGFERSVASPSYSHMMCLSKLLTIAAAKAMADGI